LQANVLAAACRRRKTKSFHDGLPCSGAKIEDTAASKGDISPELDQEVTQNQMPSWWQTKCYQDGMNLRLNQAKIKASRMSGFTLLEGMLGIGAMGFLVVSLYTGMTTGFGVVRLARENLRATQVLQEKFETIRLYTWDQINDASYIPPTFTAPLYNGNGQVDQSAYQGKVKISKVGFTEAYSDDLRLVTIELNWTSGSVARTRTISSMVARYGMQNYIY
jgi:type II secretory pathway pseudopilin PulG